MIKPIQNKLLPLSTGLINDLLNHISTASEAILEIRLSFFKVLSIYTLAYTHTVNHHIYIYNIHIYEE